MRSMRFVAWKLSLVCLLLVGATVSAAAKDTSINWFKALETAKTVANRTNQPMMIEFWADWCAPCKEMDAQVYTDPKLVAAVRDKLVAVRLHFDLQSDVARRYNVPALPYIIFTNSNGTELMHHRGILNAEVLTAVVRALPADVSELNRLDRDLQKNRNDFESLVAMGRELKVMGFFESSNAYYARAVKQDKAKNDPSIRESILLELGLNFLELQEGKQAAQVFERCLTEFPLSIKRADILLNVFRAYRLDEQTAKGRKALETLIKDFPQSEAAQTAKDLMKSP